MAGASNSDDDSGIFWPGYVDAVTNLAINLLFVIAVMALSILAAVLQIGKMKDADSYVDAPLARAICRDGFDRLLSYVRPVCAAFLLPLALMEIRRRGP